MDVLAVMLNPSDKALALSIVVREDEMPFVDRDRVLRKSQRKKTKNVLMNILTFNGDASGTCLTQQWETESSVVFLLGKVVTQVCETMLSVYDEQRIVDLIEDNSNVLRLGSVIKVMIV